MFSHLTDLRMKRTGLQALGFYVGYWVLVVVGAAVAGVILGLISGEKSGEFSNAFRLGALIAIVASITLSFAILRAKKLTGSFGLSFLAICSGLLAFFGGGTLGLIIPAIFTTKGKTSKKKK